MIKCWEGRINLRRLLTSRPGLPIEYYTVKGKWVRAKTKVLFFLSCIALSVAFVFQNCSSGKGSTASSGGTVVNESLAAQGMPVSLSINQLSFMSCANAGNNSSSAATADPLSSTFYHIRFGSYNNMGFNATSTAPNSSTGALGQQPVFAMIPGSNVGGLSFSAATLQYLKSTVGTITPDQLTNFLATSPFTNTSQPVAAVIYPNGARSGSLAPTFASSSTGATTTGTAVATTLLQPFNNSTLTSALSYAQILSDNSGSVPLSYFPAVGGPTGTLAGNLNFPVQDMAGLSQQLNSELIFFGFSNVGAGAIAGSASGNSSLIQNLVSPDNDPTQRLFGLGYQFNFTNPNANNPSYFYVEGGGMHTTSGPTSNQVQEFNLNPTTGIQAVNLTTTNSEKWDCFHLDIVRDVDRKYWVANTPTSGTNVVSFDANTGQACSPPQTSGTNNVITTGDTCISVATNTPFPPYLVSSTNIVLQPIYFQNNTAVQEIENLLQSTYGKISTPTTAGTYPYVPIVPALYPGTLAACPPEDPSTLDNLQKDKLRIIRRFLAANEWDINLSHGCAVPLPSALSSSNQCYLASTAGSTSGDSDPKKLVQYSASSSTTLANTSGPTKCGAGQLGECPATVSFCVRYQ